ncbi:MAG TPA: ABC transporter substrate-binding protein, partial [Candidatus Competibacteraceae bacterium]|nr:ABC transporter substrate-binding protein [Candidatus Competibacteraceae bacterium]
GPAVAVSSTPAAAATASAPQPASAGPIPATSTAGTASAAGSSPAPAMAEHDLTVVSWGGDYQKAQRLAFFEPFIQSTGTPLVEAEYNGTLDEVKAALKEGKTWDVVDLEFSDILKGCQDGTLERIDWSKIGDTADFMPTAVEDCGVGNIVWAYVMGYNPQKLSRPPVSWADLWDVGSLPGKRGLRKLAQWNLEIALMADGVPTKDVYKVLATPEGVDRAFNKLDQLKKHIVWWEAGAQPPELLASGEVVMSTAYNGRITNAQKQGKDLKILWTNVIYTLDYWGIVKGTPNRDKAHRFIAFASQPESQKEFPKHIPYGPVNVKAISQVEPKLLPDLPTSPTNLRFALASSADFWNKNGARLEARFKEWVAKP